MRSLHNWSLRPLQAVEENPKWFDDELVLQSQQQALSSSLPHPTCPFVDSQQRPIHPFDHMLVSYYFEQ
jgi:hypothetical protein